MRPAPAGPPPAPPERSGPPAGAGPVLLPPMLDGVVAAGLAGLALLVTAAVGGITPWTFLLVVALCTPLAWRRVRPEVAAWSVFGAAALHVLGPATYPLLADVAVLVAVYSLTAYGRGPSARVVGLAVGLVGSVAAVLRWGTGLLSTTSLPRMALSFAFFTGFVALTVLVAWGFGLLRRSQLARTSALRERARLVEVERDQQVRLATQSERARIARELHDVVAHSLSVVITQADGGRYASAARPEAALEALETIADTGRRALGEMRRLLGVLRDDAPAPDAMTAPQPGLEDLGDLVDRVRAGGLAVTLESQGPSTPLPPGLGLAAYRIVQEGLTNVLKHAGPGVTARVCLWWSPSALTVDVVDDGRGAGAPTTSDGGGHGLLGMRERAGLHGGAVQAGPLPGGGWGVRAVLPFVDAAAGGPGAPGVGVRP